jgi:hypothetical protein
MTQNICIEHLLHIPEIHQTKAASHLFLLGGLAVGFISVGHIATYIWSSRFESFVRNHYSLEPDASINRSWMNTRVKRILMWIWSEKIEKVSFNKVISVNFCGDNPKFSLQIIIP